MQELIQELIEEIKRLTEQLQDQNGQLQKQSEQLAALRKEIAEKDALIVALTNRRIDAQEKQREQLSAAIKGRIP